MLLPIKLTQFLQKFVFLSNGIKIRELFLGLNMNNILIIREPFLGLNNIYVGNGRLEKSFQSHHKTGSNLQHYFKKYAKRPKTGHFSMLTSRNLLQNILQSSKNNMGLCNPKYFQLDGCHAVVTYWSVSYLNYFGLHVHCAVRWVNFSEF